MSLRTTVVLATLNGERYLSRQLASIAEQSRKPDEVFIGDDGSTDATAELVDAFQREHPFAISLVQNKERRGTAKNFEGLLARATGDLILFADQDDVWRVDRIARTLEVFENDPELDYVFSDAAIIDQEGRATGETLWQRVFFGIQEQRKIGTPRGFEVLLRRNVVTGATLTVHRRTLERVLPIEGTWLHDGWFALILEVAGKGAAIPEPLISYRRHQEQQVGAVRNSLKSYWTFARSQGPDFFEREAQNYERLKERLAALGIGEDHRAIHLIEEKAKFLRARALIKGGSRGRSFVTALGNLSRGRYHRLGLGLRHMAIDLVRSAK